MRILKIISTLVFVMSLAVPSFAQSSSSAGAIQRKYRPKIITAAASAAGSSGNSYNSSNRSSCSGSGCSRITGEFVNNHNIVS